LSGPKFLKAQVQPIVSSGKTVKGAGAKVEENSDEIPPWRGKNHDKPINFIDSVITSVILIVKM